MVANLLWKSYFWGCKALFIFCSGSMTRFVANVLMCLCIVESALDWHGTVHTYVNIAFGTVTRAFHDFNWWLMNTWVCVCAGDWWVSLQFSRIFLCICVWINNINVFHHWMQSDFRSDSMLSFYFGFVETSKNRIYLNTVIIKRPMIKPQ